VLTQKCNFKFEIIVSDDCSVDNTATKIKEIAEKNPDIIKPFYNNPNIGLIKNAIDPLKFCSGKYIAYLSGDDFWTDPLKLQKQIDLLEINPDIVLCFTNLYSFFEEKENEKQLFYDKFIPPDVFDLDYYINNKCFTITPQTLVFRRDSFPSQTPSWFYDCYNIDWVLPMVFMEKGQAAFINNTTAMYRRHNKSITFTTPACYSVKNGITLLKTLDKHFNYKYHRNFRKIQWRYYELVIYYFQKKQYLKGFYWLFFCFFRNPISFIKNIYFIKTLYKVTFKDFEVFE
jgi:glycosyltransferase involved in cell wall biosynthesis